MSLDGLKPLAEYCIDNLALEWISQGHQLSGAAASSLTSHIEQTPTGVMVSILTDKEYMFIQNQGVRPERIKYPIQVMVNYLVQRGINPEAAKKIAWAVRAVHLREGMQTRASARYSKTGHRKGFVEDMIQRCEAAIEKLAFDWAKEYFSQKINEALKTA